MVIILEYLCEPYMPSQALLYERGRRRVDVQKRWGQCGHRGREWSDAALSQGLPGATMDWKMPRRDSPLEPPKGCGLAHTLILDFQTSEL